MRISDWSSDVCSSDLFADQRQLARTLSRDRGKDMAGDYAATSGEQDHARAFADRPAIRFPELARQVVEKVRDKARGIFEDRKRVGEGQRGVVRFDLGWLSLLKKKNKIQYEK